MDEVAARKAIADHFGVPVARVVDDAEFRDIGADSLDLIELSLALEQQFDVCIPDDAPEACNKVGDAMALLRLLMKPQTRDIAREPVSAAGTRR